MYVFVMYLEKINILINVIQFWDVCRGSLLYHEIHENSLQICNKALVTLTASQQPG